VGCRNLSLQSFLVDCSSARLMFYDDGKYARMMISSIGSGESRISLTSHHPLFSVSPPHNHYHSSHHAHLSTSHCSRQCNLYSKMDTKRGTVSKIGPTKNAEVSVVDTLFGEEYTNPLHCQYYRLYFLGSPRHRRNLNQKDQRNSHFLFGDAKRRVWSLIHAILLESESSHGGES
jgi:hypothetical protein